MTQAATEPGAAREEERPLVHLLWINAGLSCDGDSVALTAATQPSIEEIALGALPGLPRVAVHWPLIDFECGPEQGADTFIEWWHKADRGELEPFVLVVEGPIPNEAIKSEGYWCGFGNNPLTPTIGLGRAGPRTDLEIVWPAGAGRQVVRGVPLDGAVEVTEGRDGFRRLWSSPSASQ